MTFTLDTQFGTLLDDPQVVAIMDKHVPGVSKNPLIGMVRGLTLSMILASPQAAQFGITKEKAEAMLAEVNKQIK